MTELKSFQARKYSVQASPAVATSVPSAGLVSTALSNKLNVVTLDNGAPVARITIAYK